MIATTPPRHDLLDLHGERTYSTGVKWHIDPRERGKGALVFTPSHRLSPDQVSRLRWLYSVIQDREFEVKDNGVIVIPITLDEKFGWILGKVASFYRMAQNDGRFTY